MSGRVQDGLNPCWQVSRQLDAPPWKGMLLPGRGCVLSSGAEDLSGPLPSLGIRGVAKCESSSHCLSLGAEPQPRRRPSASPTCLARGA